MIPCAQPDELSDRAQDGAEPLLAIADMAGDSFAARARAALVHVINGAQGAAQGSLRIQLLADIREVMEGMGSPERILSAELVDALNAIEDAPWRERGEDGLTQNTMAWLLRDYGIAPKTIRVGDSRGKGYELEPLEDAWERYLPSRVPSRAEA